MYNSIRWETILTAEPSMRVIKDNGHRYITDKGNTFVAIMGKDNRMLVRFDYDPEDNFYKVRAEHAFDFMKTPEHWAEERTLFYPMLSLKWENNGTNRRCSSRRSSADGQP